MSDDRPAVEVVSEPEAERPAPPLEKELPLPKHLIRYEAGGIQIDTMADALSWANSVITSGFAPRGFVRASQVIVAAQTGKELGLGPAASLRALYVSPSGRPALYAESAHALCLRSGLLEDSRSEVTGQGTPDLKATYHVKRRGSAWRAVTFSLADAKTARLVKSDSGWEKYPERMVLARAKAFAYHDVFPDVLLGVAVQGDGSDEADPQEPLRLEPVATPITVPPPAAEPDPLLADERPKEEPR